MTKQNHTNEIHEKVLNLWENSKEKSSGYHSEAIVFDFLDNLSNSEHSIEFLEPQKSQYSGVRAYSLTPRFDIKLAENYFNWDNG